MTPPPTDTLKAMFQAAIASADPMHCLKPYLPKPHEIQGRLVVIGAGKAAAGMAQAVEFLWLPEAASRLSGVVVTRYGAAKPDSCQCIQVLEAAHPIPDEAGLKAAHQILNTVQGLQAHDQVLCLISGGGSSLLPMPLGNITLADKQMLNHALLQCGASIGEINTVRRHLSGIKGGRLALACAPAQVMNLIISDVTHDTLHDIASGPTVADPTTLSDARAILKRYAIKTPPHVWAALHDPAFESIKPPSLVHPITHLVATPAKALEAAAQVALLHGYTPYLLSDALEGDARTVGILLAALAKQTAYSNTAFPPFHAPCVLLSGGETTVHVKKQGGVGGRNVECLLSWLQATQGQPHLYALMADTFRQP